MSTSEIIAELKRNKVALRLVDDQVKLIGETERLSAEFIERIRERKNELRAFLQDSADRLTFGSIPTVSRQESYPASNAQQRIWVLSQYDGGTNAYNIVTGLYCKGIVMPEYLDKAFQASIMRHESLRTVFREIGGALRQIVQDRLPFNMEFKDGSDISDIGMALEAEVERAAAIHFNLAEGPLFHARLIRISAAEYALILTMHHIISDGWSIRVLLEEIMQRYDAYCMGEEKLIAPLTIQYKDYSHWLTQQIEGEKGQRAKAFWRNEFLSDVEPLDLTLDGVRPVIRSFEGAVSKYYFDNGLYNDILLFCKQYRVTLFNFLRATITILLNKFSGQQRLTIGTPASGRGHIHLEDQIGVYVNTLPLTATVDPKNLFLAFLQEVAVDSARVFEYQYYPFDKIVEDLELKHDAGRNPLFDVMLVLQDTAVVGEQARFGGQDHFQLSFLDSYLYDTPGKERRNAYAKFDLSFSFANEADNTFFLEIEYATGLFEKTRIDSFFERYQYIITQVLECPDRTLGSIGIISRQERQQILGTFNDTAADYSRDKTLVDLYREQVRKTPNDIAVVYKGIGFTYQELEERSSQFAGYLLRRYRIQPEDLVGIKLERSEWLIIVLLGVLKSGGAYVPIDPEYPQDRIRYIVEDSRCKLVVDEEELDRFRLEEQQYDKHWDAVISRPGHLAYVIYTSGSTGRPKGCMLEHRGVVNRLEWMWAQYGFDNADNILQKTTFTFDVSVWELFLPLCKGARMILSQKEDIASPERILSLVESQKVTCLHFVPGVLDVFISFLSDLDNVRERLKSLRMVVTSGEALSGRSVKSWYDKVDIPIHNLYGPTEASVDVTYYATSRQDTLVPIGRPIWNTQMYILGLADQLQPIGIPGEICIGGIGLARGYLNKPVLTAEKFVPDPFNDGVRIYRTGDLGRWLPDGNIAYIGRKDHQVKIRGFRIELGEIESVLQRYPGVEAAVVVAREDAKGEKTLVAYFVSKTNPGKADLQAHAGKALPAYMVPLHYIQLGSLPLTASGKTDRKRLPDPADWDISREAAYLPPRNEREEKLVSIWQAILDKEKIGVKDDFFDLGGHSLKATRLASQLYKEFGVKMSLNDLFIQNTPERQAQFIQQAIPTAFTGIPLAEVQRDYPLSASQRRLWVLSQFEDGNIAYNMPGVYNFEGDLDKAALEYALRTLVERHEILRTVFKENAHGDIRQFIHAPGDKHFPIIYQDIRSEKEPDEKVKSLVHAAITLPFDLANGPLLRAGLYQVADTKWIFTCVMHHIISDGWSMGVLIDELLCLYNGYIKGEVNVLQPLRIQYKDYSAWQWEQMDGEALAVHKAYWIRQFEGVLPVLELPGDKVRPTIKTYKGAVISRKIRSALAKGITECSREQGGTLFMGLLTAVNTLLYRYTGQADLIIGSPIAGREHVDLEGQVGCYINMLPLRVRCEGGYSYPELLRLVREVTLEAYAHQAYPFDELVDALDLHREMSRSPLFDVMVVLQDRDRRTMEGQDLGGIKVNRYEELAEVVSKFDLSFIFEDRDDGLLLNIEYNSDIYHHDTAFRLASHLEQLLEAILQMPSLSIQRLDYLNEQEKYQVLTGFNDTLAAYPEDKTIAALFEEQAVRTPDHIALAYNEERLTYKELQERSTQLGAYLRARYAIRPGELVGVKLERSEWLVITLLAVLKSGGAYVPIDPAYPQERIDYILTDSRCKVLIDAEELSRFEGVRHTYPTDHLPLVSGPDDLLYVIYTSGSTGKPKGCMLANRGVVNRIDWMWKHYGFSGEDIVLQKTAFTFDVSVWELFVPLCRGARMVLCSKEDAGSPEHIAGLIEKQQVTCLHFVPGMLSAFIASLSGNKNQLRQLKSLRRVFTSGEALPAQTVKSWYDILAIPIDNLYGPTEASVEVSYYTTAKQDDRIPIGRPIWNTRLYVIGQADQLLPVGVIGEIAIAGVGLATGYLNRPELTAEKFKANPLKEGERVYMTGDLGRWLPDGNLEFIGRKDDQVKIRGYRIELGEIEHALQTYAGMETGIVVARAGQHGEKELIAYLVSKNPLDIPAVRAHLGKTLPAYMIPGHFVVVDSLPLTSSGKIDRKRLPDPGIAGMGPGVEYIAARNDVEEKLVSIWQEILGREKVGVKDDFFDLGGHSLKAARLVSRINATFLIRINIRNIFQEPTIENISDQIAFIRDQNKKRQNKEKLVRIEL